MTFCYQAIDASGRAVRDTIQAGSADEAARLLKAKGLLVTRLNEAADRSISITSTAQAPAASPAGHRQKVRFKEVVYFTRQMAMLLGSGARLVSAMGALEAQARSEAMKGLIRHLRGRVEDGVPLSAALADYPNIFDGVFRSLVASGESTGRMAEAFDQIASYARNQQEVRQRIVGAMIYPMLLVVMCVGVLSGMFGFVIPRFRELFSVLGAELPASTRVLLGLSDWLRANWPVLLVVVALGAGSAVAFIRSQAGRRWWAGIYTRIPLLGDLVRRLILAKLFRIWGVLVSNNVGLLEAIRLARGTTRSTAFHTLMDQVEQAVSEGRPVGTALRESPLVFPTLAAAIVTGEESGRMGASLLFVADALESENTQIVTSLSRIVEPVILILMGAVVGVVAISLFIPMFDIATLAGGH